MQNATPLRRTSTPGEVIVLAAQLLGPLLVSSLIMAQPQPLRPPNASFEEGEVGWSFPEGCMGAVSDEQAATGARSLKIVDADGDKGGSNVGSPRLPIPGRGVWELRWKTFPMTGSGCGIYVRAYGEDGKLILPGDRFQRGAPDKPTGQWVEAALRIYTPEKARSLDILVHSYSHATVTCHLDDFELVSLTGTKADYLWPPSYKLRATDVDKLTPADFPGPDGVVYPDWTQAGVPGGIPDVPVKARLEDFGGRPNDDLDDAAALQEACASVGAQGGGAVLLSEGTYHLDRPSSIWADGVVIRGAGPDKTHLIFRYALPPDGIGFYTPAANATVGPSTPLEVHVRPEGLEGYRVEVDGTEIVSADRGPHWGNTFQIRLSGSALAGKVADGPHTLTAVARYEGGDLTASLPVVVDSQNRDPVPPQSRGIAAIQFCGRGPSGPKLKLAEDGKRGDLSLALESVEGLAPGDRLFLDGPATERWKTLTRNACPWGAYRQARLVIERIEGNRVFVNQPLRIEFPVIDGSYVQEVGPIRRCGIESLRIEQTQNLWISGVVFSGAWECWARDVRVDKCGRWPVYALDAKWCEIRDCVFNDAWFKGGGGTAYVGWEFASDCLMDGIETFAMRHAPCVQWAASGCVIRRGVFHDSDAQWHSGWTNENLFEQCVVESRYGNGGYGYGAWASPPEDTAHGPNGPRNVVYNCDLSSPKTGLWMGGMNENWLILYNRFIVDSGPAVFAKTFSFDHLLLGNVFVVKSAVHPALTLDTADCLGVELARNRLYGGCGELYQGVPDLAREEGNEALPLTGDAPRPEPAVPSIFEWQRARKPL
ncbi:MAG: hypothetical protein FJX74_18870 [Armatimonadetes bacterium]|nr:hypothetical protein [Armatimonadota bacterium]